MCPRARDLRQRTGRDLARFENARGQSGEHQRQNVIDGSKEDQCAEHLIDRRIPARDADDDGFEHADATRNMAQQAEPDGDRVNRNEARQREGGLGQQQPQRGPRAENIHAGRRDLGGEHPRWRGHEGEPPQTDSVASGRSQRQERNEQHAGEADATQETGRQAEGRRGLLRHNDEADAGDGGDPDAERGGDKRDDLGDIPGVETERGIEAIAYGAGGQRAETCDIANREREERGESDLRPGARFVDIGEGRQVVERRRDEAERREQDRRGNRAPRRSRAVRARRPRK